MITIIEASGAIEAYATILRACCASKLPFLSSRGGPVRDLGPACFQLQSGGRLAILASRRLNPFFALAEAWWVVRGERELAPLQRYIESYDAFSDDGETLNGAYGFRLRRYFGVDQLEKAITLLGQMPDTRRVVLQMWSVDDLGSVSRDIPCNTQIALKIREGALDITIFNRSNDAYLGVPYNMWVFGLMQAFVARRLGLPTGRQTHFVDSLHLYEKNFEHARAVAAANDSQTVRLLREIEEDDLGAVVMEGFSAGVTENRYNTENSVVRSVLFAHTVRRDKVTLATLQLPHTQLGLAAYLWIRESRTGDAMRRDELFERFVRPRMDHS